MSVRVHPTAMIEDGVSLGEGTSVWDHVHIRHGATLGNQCIVGGKTTIAYDVRIGNRVKINSNAYICFGVTVEDGVMISAGVIFTNDRFPRATTPDLAELRGSGPDEETFETLVKEGATIGAGAVIGCDLTIGRFAMVGMGSVVTRSVADFQLVYGNPAGLAGYVCRCGHPLLKTSGEQELLETDLQCRLCDRSYQLTGHGLSEVNVLVEATVSDNASVQ